MVDILTGIPSIVAGAIHLRRVWILDVRRSSGQGFFVSLALVIADGSGHRAVPAEEMLRSSYPNELREASYALGVPKWKTIMRIVIPTAFSGIVTGVMLGIARVAWAKLLPLLVLVGIHPATPSGNLFSGFQGTLPGMMYNQESLSSATFIFEQFAADRMWGASADADTHRHACSISWPRLVLTHQQRPAQQC